MTKLKGSRQNNYEANRGGRGFGEGAELQSQMWMLHTVNNLGPVL